MAARDAQRLFFYHRFHYPKIIIQSHVHIHDSVLTFRPVQFVQLDVATPDASLVAHSISGKVMLKAGIHPAHLTNWYHIETLHTPLPPLTPSQSLPWLVKALCGAQLMLPTS